MRPERVHLLHISKTGGTALRYALSPVADANGISLHGHKMVLRDVPEDEGVFFFVRQPASRFVSGFNSRLRMGQPRRDVPWNDKEAAAFARFSTPNQLAEALDSEDADERRAAFRAMKGVGHLRMPYSGWLEGEAYLESRRASIVLVGRTERMQDDFERLKQRLRLPASLALPDDPIRAHVTPSGFSTTLSDRGRRNVDTWYRRDVALWTYLVEHFAD